MDKSSYYCDSDRKEPGNRIQSHTRMVFNDQVGDMDVKQYQNLQKVKSDLFTPSTQLCSVQKNRPVNAHELSNRLNSVAMAEEDNMYAYNGEHRGFLKELKSSPKMSKSASKFNESKPNLGVPLFE